MPKWEGIEDVSSKPYKVWLTKVKDTDDWKPLRKCDCLAMNDSREPKILIEGGRFTADKEHGIVRANFHRAPDRTLTSAVWFVRKDTSSTPEKSHLEPISSETDSRKIETFYQMAIEASTSFGQGIDSVLKEEVVFEDGSKVFLSLTNGGTVLSMKKKPPGWLSSSLDLQRGYGTYTVEGEDIELMLGPVQHLIFCIHGIGESIWSRDGSKIPSLLEEVNRTRIALQKRQVDDWRKQCEKAKKEGKQIPKMPNRVEMIPIEWYDQIHSSSSALTKSLNAATLPTIPALRAIANEAVFDVMLYITPSFCAPILESVTDQITLMYDRFLEINPDFLAEGGKCSLIGHSLGSVICWDLLCILKDAQDSAPQKEGIGSNVGRAESTGGVQITSEANSADIGFQAYAKENANTYRNGTYGPSLPRQMEKIIPFTPEFTIFLGSPIAMFLTLRGAHPVFDEMRKQKIVEVAPRSSSGTEQVQKDDHADGKKELPDLPYASPFKLPSGAIYNIYHPSDPVAYRIEPLLLPPEMLPVDFPSAVHLTGQGQSVRLHVKAQQFGDEVGKFFEGKKGGLGSFLMTQAVSALGKVEASNSPTSGTNTSSTQVFPLGGKSERVDFQLQRGLVDNEYLSAVTAHSNYFVNTDFQDFLMGVTARVDDATKQKALPDKI